MTTMQRNKSGKCALCQIDGPLAESHIIPKFLTNYIKNTSLTGYLRHSENPNIPQQDGFKEYLLCFSCENQFSKYEKQFAEQIFHPYFNKGIEEFEYSDWLTYFITSVNWRILYHFLIESLENRYIISIDNYSILANLAIGLQKYLLGEKTFPDDIVNHLYFIDFTFYSSLIAQFSLANLNPIVFLGGSCFSDIAEDPDLGDYLYIYTNLCGILAITEIKKPWFDQWENTKVFPRGIIKKSNQKTCGALHVHVLYKVVEASRLRISENQQNKFQEKINKLKIEDIATKNRFLNDYEKDLFLNEILKNKNG